jgi:hypothetical protein
MIAGVAGIVAAPAADATAGLMASKEQQREELERLTAE